MRKNSPFHQIASIGKSLEIAYAQKKHDVWQNHDRQQKAGSFASADGVEGEDSPSATPHQG
jgi:hypothetical protein